VIRSIALSLLFVLVFTTAACAHTPLQDPRFARADAVAVAYWGKAAPCDSTPWYSMKLTYGVVADATNPHPCARRIAKEILSSLSWPQFCDVAVHEYGHLLEYGHTGDDWPWRGPTPAEDPAGVMATTGAEVPACHTNRRDGRTRSPRSKKDRQWCSNHYNICAKRYPNLASAVSAR
jgi:hypothetical protein